MPSPAGHTPHFALPHVALPHVALVKLPIDVAALLKRVSDDGVGAVTLFLGTVRNVNDGRIVSGIEYEAYDAMAVNELEAIVNEVLTGEPELRLAVEHRVGTLVLGEVSVAIAAGHAHRAMALDASRNIIDAIKRRVPIWKRERYVEGDWSWVDPTRDVAPQSFAANAQ